MITSPSPTASSFLSCSKLMNDTLPPELLFGAAKIDVLAVLSWNEADKSDGSVGLIVMVPVILIFALTLAAAVTIAITPCIIWMAEKTGAVDVPGPRRVNIRRVPRMGGLAIVFGIAIGVAASVLLTGPAAWTTDFDPLLFGLSVLMVLGLGIWDDLSGLSAPTKFAVQTVAALTAYQAGLCVTVLSIPFVGPLELGMLAPVLTVLWFVGVTNAVNLIDGLDGLAAGLSAIAAIGLCAMLATIGGVNVATALVSAAVIGACVGFLRYNFHPAAIFMGDTGSLTLGFLLAALSLSAGNKLGTATVLAVPSLILVVPLIDSMACFVRRVVGGRSPFSGDLGHVHHLLLNSGFNQRGVALLLYAVSAVFTILATLLAHLRNEIFLTAVILGVLVLTALFYHRYRLFSPRMLLAGRRLRRLLDRLEQNIQQAPNVPAAMHHFRRAGRLLSLTELMIIAVDTPATASPTRLRTLISTSTATPTISGQRSSACALSVLIISDTPASPEQQRCISASGRSVHVVFADHSVTEPAQLYARQLLLEPLLHRLAERVETIAQSISVSPEAASRGSTTTALPDRPLSPSGRHRELQHHA